MEGGKEGGMKREVESLGWLTESSIMPKKHKAIEGVGASSILELKAQLYKSQEENRKSKDLTPDIEFHRAKKKIVPADTFSNKNSGVEARAHKDKLELKAVQDGSVSYAALERKAALYDKLARGELPDEEEGEKYCVDFFSKSLVRDDPQHLQIADVPDTIAQGNEDGDDTDAFLPFSTKPVGPGRTAGFLDNDERKRFVREVHEEANQARDKASELKMRRQEQAISRREKLKQAYLRKQVEKLQAKNKEESKQDAV
ncbi:hypothetical protein C5167_012316 [Papaver somniferum]|uniref:Uncharacterized protein n=1 Tax=Papaver somniferum TaxID=3469 RepID=A0A4Y7J134_PAPSO|nr:uncharacterized protein At4g18257-like [Papaver somniferum]RZC53479.1 hypothetical protein C5167_012316 [Papaver somniferum]